MTVFDKLESAACDCDRAGAALMSVRDASDAALAVISPVVATQVVPIGKALGRVLAAPVKAAADMPPFDNSGMDGYAFRHADLGASGVLPVSGTSAAGDPIVDLPPGAAMRIYTGAPVPRGADTVVMQEAVRRSGHTMRLTAPCTHGANIRKRGTDRAMGATILLPGVTLDARRIAICAGAGAGHVTVRRRPRVALVLTGDELTPTGEALRDGAIWDVNAPMLAALIHEAGADLIETRHVPDNRKALTTALAELAGRVDMIVTSGGVSVGDRDHMSGALHDMAAKTVVSGMAIKPGKPVTIAKSGRCTIVGLPGNPVSAFVTWHVLGRPMVARLSGLSGACVARRHVRAGHALRHKPGRCEYRPATIMGYDLDGHQVITCRDHMRSSELSPMAEADGMILIPADAEQVQAGDLLEFLPFDGMG